MSTTKTFSMTPIELRLLGVEQELHNAKISNLLTYFATTRLAYHVTENTQFAVDDGELIITEVDPAGPEAEPEVVAPVTGESTIADAAGAGNAA